VRIVPHTNTYMADPKSHDQKKLMAVRDLIITAERSVQSAKKILASLIDPESTKSESLEIFDTAGLSAYSSESDKIVEGIFTGESMLGSDGNTYPVPHNYASKSQIVQGSKLKATIRGDGRIIYKIIDEIEHEVTMGILTKTGERYQIVSEKKTYNVLLAAVTYIRGEVGDSVSIKVPKGKDATYAAIVSKIPK